MSGIPPDEADARASPGGTSQARASPAPSPARASPARASPGPAPSAPALPFVARLPMLARLATRYARRHRTQTVRAVLGLLVVSLVLAMGLGLGDSLGASLERGIEARFGPVDVVARGPPHFNDTLAAQLVTLPALEGKEVRGATTLIVIGSILDNDTGLAEAFASLRGVHPAERDALGPLPGGASDPGPGEVVLSQALADRIGAEVGHRITMRALPTDLNETFGFGTTEATGSLGPAGAFIQVSVKEEALGLLATIRADGDDARATLQSPSGQAYPAERQGDSLEIRILGSLPAGTWNLTVTGQPGADYQATIRVGYTPPAIESLVVVLEATVAGIVPTEGRAAITPRPMAMLPLADLQAALGMQGLATHAYFHAPSDATGVARTMQSALRQGLVAGVPGVGDGGAGIGVGTEGPGENGQDDGGDLDLDTATGNRTWRVDALKEEAIERVHRDAGNLSGFILVMGGFTIVASMLLAYVLFSSLVEERRVELGIARAVGLTRLDVGVAMVLEALVYSVLAAAVGLALGIGLVVVLLHFISAYSADLGGPAFFLHLAPTTLPVAFLGGVLLPITTIAVGTFRFARLDPARAIRGAPEDVRVHRRSTQAAGAVLLLAGLALSLHPIWRTVGVGLAAAGATTFLLGARRRGWAALVATAGIAYTAWTLYSFDAFPETQRQLDPVITMLRALVLTLLAASLLMCSPRPFAALGRAFGRLPGLRRAAYVSLRYLGSRRVQAGLTTAMVAVVAVIVTVMGTLAAIFAGSLVRDEGGYDIVGQSPFPLTTFPRPLADEDQAATLHAEFLPVHRPLGNPRMTIDGEPFREGRFVRFAGVSPAFAQDNGYKILDRHAQYASDRDAWLAVAAGEAVLAPPWYFDPGGLVVGGRLEIPTGSATQEYLVAGMVPDARRGDIYLAYDDVRGMRFPQTATVLIRVAPDADAAEVAHRLTAQFQENGLVFESVAEEVREAEDILRATVMVLQSFLFLGVFVGISSTGFLAARAVHERMRDIGTLRAMGYESTDVSKAFLLESGLVSLLGLVLGTVVGLLVAHAIWWRSVRSFGGSFVLPWGVLLAFAVAVMLLTAWATWKPTRRASRLDPAMAVRHVE